MTDLTVQGRPVALDDHLQWLWAPSLSYSVLKVDARVIGFTPKRIRVRVFDEHGDPITKTLSPENLHWPRPSKHPSPHLTNMAGRGNANDLEKWLAFNRTLTWERLSPS